MLVLAAVLVFCVGCGEGVSEEPSAETTIDATIITTTEPETTIPPIDPPEEIPQLPKTGKSLDDFIPEGWYLMDSVSIDFNEDGAEDYVGVLEHLSVKGLGSEAQGFAWGEISLTRILFALRSAGKQYQLDFQDAALIRRQGEGGMMPDPYFPLTVDGKSFTTHAWGGSGWKWAQDHTYQYRDGTWYMVKSHETSYYGGWGEYERIDDYATGIGLHKSNDLETRYSGQYSVPEDWDEESGAFYFETAEQVKLGPPPTLEAFSKKFAQQMRREY